MIRKIVEIDNEKCDGCGLCVPACAEGAIRIENGKAVLSADNLCDGLGACLGDCPRDAIRIVEREAEEFDEQAVEKHLAGSGKSHAPAHAAPSAPAVHGGCPGSRAMTIQREERPEAASAGEQPSELRQWPVQLHLVPASAPYLQNADLLIAADCVPFAYAGFHSELLKGKAVLIGCPKLDDNLFYRDKLTEIFRTASPRSITVVRMEVPCCGGIVAAARQALAACGKEIPFREVTVTIDGRIR